MPRKKHQDDRDWIYSPEGFDAGDYGIPSRLDVHCRWVLNCLHFSRVLTGRDLSDYVPLHSAVLAKVMGRTNLVVEAVSACLDAGLIEIDGGLRNYKKGERSRRFRLGEDLQGVKFRKWNAPGTRFAERVASYRGHLTDTSTLDEIGHHLRGWVERVEFVGVEDVIADIEDSMPTRKNKNVDKDAKRDLARHQVEVLAEHRLITSKRDDFGRRFHSNLTGLVSEVRKNCLAIDGSTLVEIDIANSQPYQLACLIYSAKHSSQDRTGSIQVLESHWSQDSIPDVYHNVPVPGSIEEFVDDVLTARLYDRMVHEGGLSSVGRSKKNFFWEIYSEDSPMILCWRLYPQLAEFVERWKVEQGHKTIPQEMQRLESSAMIDGVCGRLMRDYPDVPVITCHDSILCRESDVDLMVDLIEEAHAGNPFQPALRVNGELLFSGVVL